MNIKLCLLLIITTLLCSQAFSADAETTISTYLSAGHNMTVMAIGEGKVYNNFDNSTFLVDIEEATNPDFVADINDIEQMGKIPSDSFDKILLCNIPTPVFDMGAFTTFQNLHRILKAGGTLEFNDMWGGTDAEAIKDQVLENQDSDEGRAEISKVLAKDIVQFFMDKHMLNPFNHYLIDADYEGMNGVKLTESPLWVSYTAQLQKFFSDAGFQSVTFDGKNSWIVKK